jgi:hypothetical protein
MPKVMSVKCLAAGTSHAAGTTSARRFLPQPPRDCTSIFLPPATRKPAHTHTQTLLSFLSLLTLPRAHSFVSTVDFIPAVYILPPLNHRSRAPQLNAASSTKSPHVNHELAAEESCALVRHPSRRQRFHISQCTFAGIGEISPQRETHTHVTMQVEMKRTAAALPLPLTTSKLVNKLPRESPKVFCALYHEPTTAPNSHLAENQDRRQR